jgi:hypothetical protein
VCSKLSTTRGFSVRQGKIGVGDGDGQNRILLNAAELAGGIAFFKGQRYRAMLVAGNG